MSFLMISQTRVGRYNTSTQLFLKYNLFIITIIIVFIYLGIQDDGTIEDRMTQT